MTGHRISYAHAYGNIEVSLTCEEAPDADCRWTCTEGCPSWPRPLLVDVDGLRWHGAWGDDGERETDDHLMRRADCALVEYLAVAKEVFRRFEGGDGTQLRDGEEVTPRIVDGDLVGWDYA